MPQLLDTYRQFKKSDTHNGSKIQPYTTFFASALLSLWLCLGSTDVLAQEHIVDFESIAAGQLVEEVSSTRGYGGIRIYGEHASCPLRNTAITFNSDCPDGCTGNDDDLGTPNETFGGPGIGEGGEAGSEYPNVEPIGNILIIHQFCNDLNDLPVQNPRNFAGQSKVLIDFPGRVTFLGLKVIDVESNELLEVEYFDALGNSLGQQSAPATGDNGVFFMYAEDSDGNAPVGVTQVVITREGSGAIDNLAFIPELADLSLTAEVDNPAPETGDEVTFTFVLRNDGPNDASEVTVDYVLPSGLTLQSQAGLDQSDDGHTVTWSPGFIATGDSLVHSFGAIAEDDTTMAVIGEVMSSDLPDPDSTPGNNNEEEDDQDFAVVTPGQSSGGGDGGIESEGNMATHLARRLFHRRIDAQAAKALQKTPKAILFSKAPSGTVFNQSSAGAEALQLAVPEEGPLNTLAYEVTPQDLLDITNATRVLSVDYLQVNGRRLGAIFSAISPSGALYDHSKTSCDRLGGGRLENVHIAEINDKPFVMSTLIHPDGAVDYSVSFVAYRTGQTYYIDSRFTPNEYEIPDDAEEIVNLQIWGVAPAFTEELTRDFLNLLSEQGSVIYLNTTNEAPNVFVMDGEYRQGQVVLRFVNRVGNADVTVRGSFARTEAEAASQTRTPFQESIRLQASESNEKYQTVTIETGPLFDITLTVEHDQSSSQDQLYHADGAWSYSMGSESNIDHFMIEPHNELFAQSMYAIERSGSLSGNVKDWASLFKYLRPNGLPVNLSDYSHLSFIASGTGDVRLILEKESIDDWDQYGHTFALTPEPTYFRIPFNRLRKENSFDNSFTAEDITLIAFYALGNGQSETPFSMNIEQLAFGGSTLHGAPDLPSGFALDQNFPNPFNPTTQLNFRLEEPMPVRLSVFDMLGREIAILVDGMFPEGESSVTFDAENFPSGLYLYRIETPRGSTARIMSLLK